MLDPSLYVFCSEFHIVEKAVEVVVNIAGESNTIRIEAHKQNSPGGYCTRSYIQRDITVQPTYPLENGRHTRKPESITVWAIYNLPWTDGDSADAALTQALGFLGERCVK